MSRYFVGYDYHARRLVREARRYRSPTYSPLFRFHFYSSEFKPGPFNAPRFPDTSLINGKGRHPYSPISEIAVVTVQPGKRYRMRVIQMACYTNFEYSIDGHSLTVIEADGVLTKPYEAESIYVYAGQRYSHILDTRKAKYVFKLYLNLIPFSLKTCNALQTRRVLDSFPARTTPVQIRRTRLNRSKRYCSLLGQQHQRCSPPIHHLS